MREGGRKERKKEGLYANVKEFERISRWRLGSRISSENDSLLATCAELHLYKKPCTEEEELLVIQRMLHE